MDFITYTKTFNFSAIANPVVSMPYYVALGMAGESGEALEKVLEGDTPGLILELGDVAWYVSKMAAVLKLRLTPTVEKTNTLMETVARLSVQTSAVADLIKKTLRDGTLKTERVHEHLNNSIGLISAAADMAGSDLPTVLLKNRQKLLDRQRRKVIHGSGDYR